MWTKAASARRTSLLVQAALLFEIGLGRERLRIGFGVDPELLEHRHETIPLVRRRRFDPAADDVVGLDRYGAAVGGEAFRLDPRGALGERAERVRDHAQERREELLGPVVPAHPPIASSPVAARPMMSFWICVVPS